MEDSVISSRQRVTDVTMGKSVDRIPCLPLIDMSYAASVAGMPVSDCFLNPVRHAEALALTLKRHAAIDGLSINICLADDIILERETNEDSHTVQTTGGLTWYIPKNDIGSVQEVGIKSFDDPRIDTDDPFTSGIINTLKAIPDQIRQEYFINAGVMGPFSQVAFLMGLENVMMATIDNPSGLLDAIERRLPFALQWIEQLADLNTGGVWIGEGVASASLISPTMYRKFVLPFEKILFDRLKELQIPGILHICGKLDGILDIIPETGCNCLEFDWQVDIDHAVKRIGESVSLKGNLNTSELVQSNAEEIYKLSCKSLKSGLKSFGYLLSSGCCIGRDTPPENIDAMIQACIDLS